MTRTTQIKWTGRTLEISDEIKQPFTEEMIEAAHKAGLTTVKNHEVVERNCKDHKVLTDWDIKAFICDHCKNPERTTDLETDNFVHWNYIKYCLMIHFECRIVTNGYTFDDIIRAILSNRDRFRDSDPEVVTYDSVEPYCVMYA